MLDTSIKDSAIRRLLLAGAGHAHTNLLRRLSNQPLKNVEVTLVSEQPQSIYSGMLPGWMAGHYTLDEITIDIIALCKRAGVRLLPASIAAVDADTQTVITDDNEQFDYDLLSLNTGADTDLTWLAVNDSIANDSTKSDAIIPIRPLHLFIEQWQQILIDAHHADSYQIAIVGAGAAATELVMAAQFALQQINPKHHACLVCGEHLLSGFDESFKDRVVKQLKRHNISIIYERAADFKTGQLFTTHDALKVNVVIAATGVTGSAWTTNTNLETTGKGFIAVNANQQSISHPNVFAVGDVSTRVDRQVAHSGVHAVFGGAIEADNLLAYLSDEPLKSYRPKNRILYLLSCGDQYAIGSWGKFSLQGRWVWHVKRFIDKRFVNAK